MKTTRTLLIEQAARDHADEGTEWRKRVNTWLDSEPPVHRIPMPPPPIIAYRGDFGCAHYALISHENHVPEWRIQPEFL